MIEKWKKMGVKCSCGGDTYMYKYGHVRVDDYHIYDDSKVVVECSKCHKSTRHLPIDMFSCPNGDELLLNTLKEEIENE